MSSSKPVNRALRPQVTDAASYNFTPATAAVKLDQNESPFPLPLAAAARLSKVLESVPLNRYPDMEPVRLQAALAQLHDWPTAGVTVAGGSNILIQSLVIAAGIGQRVVTVAPTFSVYALQARLLGAELTEVPLGPGFSLPLPALQRELAQGGGVLFIAAPAAPTGNLPTAAELTALQEAAAGNWLFVIDEAYHQFAGSDFSDLARSDGVVVLRTLSKAAGLAGLRLGYALSSPELAEQLRKVILPFSVSDLQQELALAVLEHQDELQANVRELIRERVLLQSALERVPGVTAFPSDANFILFRVAAAARVHALLLQQGILIRRQDHLAGLSGCLRVSVGLPAENQAFLAALTAIMTTDDKGVVHSE